MLLRYVGRDLRIQRMNYFMKAEWWNRNQDVPVGFCITSNPNQDMNCWKREIVPLLFSLENFWLQSTAYDWTDRFSATSVAIFRSYLFVVLVTQLSGTEVLMPEGFPIKLEAGILINKWYIRRQRSAEIFMIQNQECPTTFFQNWSVDRHHQLPLDEHQ